MLLSKAGNISIETSNSFTEFEFRLSFEALEDFVKAQEEQQN